MTSKASQLAAFVSAANVASISNVATFVNDVTFNSDVTFANGAITANGSIGTAGQVLASTGNGAMYWTDMAAGGNSNFSGSYNNLTDKPDIISPFLLMGA